MSSTSASGEKCLVWITGYSASGKTSIAQQLVQVLRSEGESVVHLDGDELRLIFGKKWGHSFADKIELSLVYMRLSHSLVQQGHIVILSAISMFQEIYDWLTENVPNSFLVLVEAPLETRVMRDSSTKNIYSEIYAQGEIYELPKRVDLRIQNRDGANVLVFARQIATQIRKG